MTIRAEPGCFTPVFYAEQLKKYMFQQFWTEMSLALFGFGLHILTHNDRAARRHKHNWFITFVGATKLCCEVAQSEWLWKRNVISSTVQIQVCVGGLLNQFTGLSLWTVLYYYLHRHTHTHAQTHTHMHTMPHCCHRCCCNHSNYCISTHA